MVSSPVRGLTPFFDTFFSFGETAHLNVKGEEPSFAARYCECYYSHDIYPIWLYFSLLYPIWAAIDPENVPVLCIDPYTPIHSQVPANGSGLPVQL